MFTPPAARPRGRCFFSIRAYRIRRGAPRQSVYEVFDDVTPSGPSDTEGFVASLETDDPGCEAGHPRDSSQRVDVENMARIIHE